MNIVLVIGCLLVLSSCVAAQTPKFCSKSEQKCNMANINVTCVTAMTDAGCTKDVADGKADMTYASADDLVKQGDKLKIVYSQKLKGIETFVQYYGLAVVKKGTNFNFKQLKGKKSCHTGVGKTVGWKIPVGYLLFTKEMGWNENQYMSASEFFSKSCAPGINNIAGVSKEVKDKLCFLCNGTCNLDDPNKDPYAGYEGAFKCMASGNNDRVGFVKQTTADDVLKKTGGKYGNKSDYQLLCTDGKTAALDDYLDCYIDKRPASALVTSKDKSDAMFKRYQTMLENADLNDLKKGGMVDSDIESLEKYTDTVKEYVGSYADHYNALAGPSAAPSIIASIVLQVVAIFTIALFV